jgi:hypothetical protein
MNSANDGHYYFNLRDYYIVKYMVNEGRNLILARINTSISERQGVIFNRSRHYLAVYCYIYISPIRPM